MSPRFPTPTPTDCDHHSCDDEDDDTLYLQLLSLLRAIVLPTVSMDSNGSDSTALSAGRVRHVNTSGDDEGYTKLVSDTTAFYFELAVYVIASAVVSILGMAANTVNIIVFVRQGIFTENGSASLLCLAISDLCCVFSMLWLSTTVAIVLYDPPASTIPFDPIALWTVTGAFPHHLCAQITRMVTAYVTFERCICVVFPFKVKSIFTAKRTLIIVASIFVCFSLTYSPLFIVRQLSFKFDITTNTTRLIFNSHPDWIEYVEPTYYVNHIAFNVGAVVIVLICTMVTVSRVKLSRAWKKSLNEGTDKEDVHIPTTSGKQESVGSSQLSNSKMQKEKKLVRMITSISLVFLVCYTPDWILMIMTAIDPEIRVPGKQINLAMVMYSLVYFMETVNSTINILVYYNMSSRFNQELKALFGGGKN